MDEALGVIVITLRSAEGGIPGSQGEEVRNLGTEQTTHDRIEAVSQNPPCDMSLKGGPREDMLN